LLPTPRKTECPLTRSPLRVDRSELLRARLTAGDGKHRARGAVTLKMAENLRNIFTEVIVASDFDLV